jgi:MEDS: MEthanogen/methylotroph, DcmR Sensory domain
MESPLRVLSPWRDWLIEPLSRDHLVQIYGDDESLAVALSTYVGAGLAKGEAAVVIATPDHAAAVRARLSAEGLETADLERWGQLRILDARDMLDELLVSGTPDPDQFGVLSRVLISDARQASRNGRVRVYGEMVNLLWSRGQCAAALRLEELWSEIIAANAVPLYCAYRVELGNVLPAALCDVHTHVLPLTACA